MKARSCLLLLPVALCCAGAAEPKPRPRLPAPVVSEVKREVTPPALGAGFAARFRSFDDFLQAEGRRPVGLEAFPEVAAARAETARAEKTGQVAKSSSASSPADATSADVLVLPKMEVTAEKLTKLKTELAALEASQSWQAHSAEAWENRSETSLVLDAILNPSFLRLGSYSGDARAAIARQRVEMLRWVRILKISLEEAKTPAEKARIQADINAINDVTRMWE